MRGRREGLLLTLIVAVAALLRFWQLDSLPPGYHYDEAYEGWEAWRLLTKPDYRPIFFTGNFGVEPMFIYLTAAAFALFGAEPAVQRGVAALIGTLTVPALWLLARELCRWEPRLPRQLPLWSAAVLATLFWGIHASRIGYEPVLVPLFLCLLLTKLLAALRKGDERLWLGMGLLLGLSLYTYPVARLFPLLLALLLVMAWLWRRADRAATVRPTLPRRGLAALLLGAALTGGPLLLYWAQYPELFLLRSSQIATVPGGAGQGTPGSNLVATALMFTGAGDIDPRNNLPGRPIFDWLLGLSFYGGLALLLWRSRNYAVAALLAALAAMLAPTIFSEYAPHFRRALGALPLVALAAGGGLVALGRVVPTQPPVVRWARPAAAGAILIISAFLSAQAYFVRWAALPDLFYAFDVGLVEVARQLDARPPDEARFLTPGPTSHMTYRFLWRERPPPTAFDGRHIFVAPASLERPVTYAVVSYEDFRTPLLLPTLFPDSAPIAQIDDGAGQPYATLYRVPAGSRVAFDPETATEATWEGAARLLGTTWVNPTVARGTVAYLRFYWEVEAPIGEEWTMFVHLLNADGQNVLGRDQPPGSGSYPTTQWQPGQRLLDEVQLPIPADFPPGDYRVEIGFYRADGSRLTVTTPQGAADHLILGTLTVTAE